jgi:hypothetical protein
MLVVHSCLSSVFKYTFQSDKLHFTFNIRRCGPFLASNQDQIGKWRMSRSNSACIRRKIIRRCKNANNTSKFPVITVLLFWACSWCRAGRWTSQSTMYHVWKLYSYKACTMHKLMYKHLRFVLYLFRSLLTPCAWTWWVVETRNDGFPKYSYC